jgi:hypothetical protein
MRISFVVVNIWHLTFYSIFLAPRSSEFNVFNIIVRSLGGILLRAMQRQRKCRHRHRYRDIV